MGESEFRDREQVVRYLRDRRNWDRWPATSGWGTLNLVTASNRLRATASVRDGAVVSLSRPVSTEHSLRNPSPLELIDRLIPAAPDMQGVADRISLDYHGYATTHLDALCHVWAEDGVWRGEDVERNLAAHGDRRWGHIGQWETGVVTSAVLLDIPELRDQPWVDLERPVTDADLEAAGAAQGVEVSPGDAVVIHMGRRGWESAHPAWSGYTDARPGLDASCLRFLRERDVAAVVWDFSDARPNRYSMHWTIHLAIPYFGLALVDNADTEALAEECRRRGRHEFLLVVAPRRLVGATGSPVNPLAIL